MGLEKTEQDGYQLLSHHQQVLEELRAYWHNGKPGLKPLHHLERRLKPHGTTLEDLREEYGLHTPLSPERQLSRRAQFLTKFRDAIDEYGVVKPGYSEAYAAAANLHEAALSQLTTLLNISFPSLSERNIKVIWGITGSYMRKKPKLGINMVGITYEEAEREYSHLLYPKRYHTPLPSDFDIGVAWQVSHSLLFAYFKDIYKEYGIYFEAIAPQPGDHIEFTDIETVNRAGGLRRFLQPTSQTDEI